MSGSREAISRAEAVGFLTSEAYLLDEWRLTEWLALWDTKNVEYWVPYGDDAGDPSKQVSVIYDDWTRLNERVARLQSPAAHSQDPRSRLRRVVGNVEVAGESADGGGTVASNFVLGEFRGGVQTLYMGRLIHTLVGTDSGVRIRSKKVLLLNNSGSLGNVSFIF